MNPRDLITSDFAQREEEVMNLLESYTGREIPNLGLEHLRPLFAPFKEEFKKRGIKIVTVAGTNGKGESAYSLAHLLKEAGIAASVWSSPHILSLRERFIIDHEFINYDCLEQGIELACAQKLELTYYELLFYVFCQTILKARSKIIILEVGLGGRLDAVNLFDADITLLTSLSRDHMSLLGLRYEEILREKLGVVRGSGVHFSALKSVYLQERQAQYLKGREFHDLYALKLLSHDVSYRESNRTLAYVAFKKISAPSFTLTRELAREALKKTFPIFKGRFEKMTDGARTFIFIGAHNPDGFRTMVKALEKEGLKDLTTWVAFSAREMKDIRSSLGALLSDGELVRELVLTRFDHPRSWNPSEGEWRELVDYLKRRFKRQRISVSYSEEAPIIFENGTTTAQNILVCGSYYFVGAIQRALIGRFSSQ